MSLSHGDSLPGLRVFISYRRDDSSSQAGRLYDALGEHFGEASVFMDIEKIEIGVDFKEAIESAVGACDVLIVLVGPDWLTIADGRGERRLDRGDDYVRLEIEAALERNVRVVPALLQGAAMPAADELPGSLVALARRNAIEISEGVRWRSDVARLVRFLERVRAETGLSTSIARPDRWRHGATDHGR